MNYPNYISELLEVTYDMWKKAGMNIMEKCQLSFKKKKYFV